MVENNISDEQSYCLDDNEIHVWVINLNEHHSQEKKLLEDLNSEEKEKYNNYKFNKDKKTYLVTRGVLRYLLANYINNFPGSIEFYFNQYGKPFLKNNPNDIQFNVSHSGDYALIAITKNNLIGVDIEKINPEFSTDEIAKKYFSDTELNEIEKLDPKNKVKGFFNIWSRKEAYIKCFGKGLSIPLNEFSVTHGTQNPSIIKSHNQTSECYIYNLDIHHEYAAAVMIIGMPKNVNIFKYRE